MAVSQRELETSQNIYPLGGQAFGAFNFDGVVRGIQDVIETQLSFGKNHGDRFYSSDDPEVKEQAEKMKKYIGELGERVNRGIIRLDDSVVPHPEELTDLRILGGFANGLKGQNFHYVVTDGPGRTTFIPWAAGTLLGYTIREAMGIKLSDGDKRAQDVFRREILAEQAKQKVLK